MPRKKNEDVSFGPRLTALRKARGMTQVQLAEGTKATHRSISYDEHDDGVRPSSLPEQDQCGAIRLINSLAAVGSLRKNGAEGVRNGR